MKDADVAPKLFREYFYEVNARRTTAKVVTPQQAMLKAEAWCAYQERCQEEVREKLFSWGLHERETENIIADLIANNFINEERFAIAYAGGKFRIKKWGRVKIRIELKRRKISPYCINKALSMIDDEDYLATLKKLLEKKSKEVKEKHPLKKKYKLMNFLVSKGFESDIVNELVNGH